MIGIEMGNERKWRGERNDKESGFRFFKEEGEGDKGE